MAAPGHPVFINMMVTVFVMLALMPTPAHSKDPPVQKFRIHIDQGAYTKMPVWIQADLSDQLTVRYPYQEDPLDFGTNLIELKQNGHVVKPPPSHALPAPPNGPASFGEQPENSLAPLGSPKNRLPLHLKYPFNNAGLYSVRWTRVRQYRTYPNTVTNKVVARSNWLDFAVQPSTPKQRHEWLQKHLSSVPQDSGQLVGDFLPSLLASAPDPKALPVVLQQLYSSQSLVSHYALYGLLFFRDSDVSNQLVAQIEEHGPTSAVVDLIMSYPQFFRGQREQIVNATLPYLQAKDDDQVAATLKLLGSLMHTGGNSNWPKNSTVPARTDQAVVAAAPDLAKRGRSVLQPLAAYLGSVKGKTAREPLWLVAERPEAEHEQALIALCWIGDPRDLPRLSNILLKPGDKDKYGADISSLPNSLILAYGDSALPYLEKALTQSPYAFVRTQCAQQLALKGSSSGFRFFLDAIENKRFYKDEMITWLKDSFADKISTNADDKAVVAFLNSRVRKQSPP